CHTMRVVFDRPVYFTQSNRPKTPPKPAAPVPKGQSQPDDRAKLDVVYCYPAPGDTAEGEQEKFVTFDQVERDPETGKPFKRQRLQASELILRAQARDSEGGEPYQEVTA